MIYHSHHKTVFAKMSDQVSVRDFEGQNIELTHHLTRLLSILLPDLSGLQVMVVTQERESALLGLLEILSELSQKSLHYQVEDSRILVFMDDQLVYLVVEGDQAAGLQKGVALNVPQDSPLKKGLLIATRNKGKTKEFKQLLEPLGYQIKDLTDFPELPEVEETGMTFEANARQKAETISQLTQEMVLADDSGLMVDILGGLPGVWSARFAGKNATDAANNAKLMHELASTAVTPEKRTAKFHTSLVVAAPNRDSLVVEAEWPGKILTIPRGDNGFGYDPLFQPEDWSGSAAEMPLEEKNKRSHRAKAIQKLLKALPEWLAKQG